MKENKKEIIIFLVISLLLLIGIIVSVAFLFKKNSDELEYNNPKKIVTEYFNSIINEDYSTAFKYIYLPQDCFANKENFEEFIKGKSYYNDLKSLKLNSIKEIDAQSYKVILNDKDNNELKININLVQRTINDYRIDESDFYTSNYKVTVPKNTKLSIDGVLVDSSFKTKSTMYEDTYTLPSISKTNKKFKLENKLFNKELDYKISEEENEKKFIIELDGELKDKVYNFIKNTWNTMYNNFKNKKNISTVRKYFTSEFTDSDIKKVYKTSFNKITKGLTSIGEFNKYNITKIIDNKNEASIINSDEYITVNFGYTLNWRWKYISADSAVKMSMNRYSSIMLKVEEDTFKIYDIIDIGLFNYADRYTRDF